MNNKVKSTKKNSQSKSSQSNKRVNKNKSLYVKNKNKSLKKKKKLKPTLILFFAITLLQFIFIVHHYLTYNHHKVKVVTKIKEKEIVPENIVFLGDSITWMYDLDKYYKGKRVVNSGISGDSTEDIIKDMNNRVYRYNPSKVFILIGTNDITDKKTKEQIVDNIQIIIDYIQKNRPKCKIYLESIYPINNTNDQKINKKMVSIRNNEFIKEINDELKQISEKSNITYINLYDEIVDKEGNLKIEYTKEGLHISEKGYEKITTILKKYI